MTMIPYGTQLPLWEDLPHDQTIVFELTWCVIGCPFNGVFEATRNGVTLYAQQFGPALLEPAKYLITVQKNKPLSLLDRYYYYIADDQWKAFDKIRELTGLTPLWRMEKDTPSTLPIVLPHFLSTHPIHEPKGL